MNPNTVVAWFGPVNLTQVGPDAQISGLKSINLTCTGDGIPSCGAIAEGFTDQDGRRLPNLLTSKGVDPNAEVIVGAFSAGGSIAKRLCLNHDDREQIKAVMLADATYTTGGVDEGFVEYALDVLERTDKMFVATASSAPNKNYPTGVQTLALLRGEIERRAGRSFTPVSNLVTSRGLPFPGAAWNLGNVWFLEYPNVAHGEQVTWLAGQVWRALLMPWLEGAVTPGPGPGPTPPSEMSLWRGLAALGAAALGFVLARGVQRNRRFQKRHRYDRST